MTLKDLKFEEKWEFEIWDMAKGFKSIAGKIWDLS